LKIFNKILDYFNSPKIEFYSIIPGLEEINPPALGLQDRSATWIKNRTNSTKELVKKIEEFTPEGERTTPLFIMEKCPGIRGVMNEGIHLRTWQDIKISLISDDGKYIAETPIQSASLINGNFISPEIQSHSGKQFPEFCEARDDTWPHILKIMSNWRVKISPEWQFLLLPNYYSNESPYFSAVPGVFNPEFGNHLNINIQIHRKAPNVLFIPAGTTIVKLIPIRKEQKYNFKIRSVNQRDIIREQTNLAVLKKRYISNRKEQISDLNKIEKKMQKCPFLSK
jgi:hypothetical protein